MTPGPVEATGSLSTVTDADLTLCITAASRTVRLEVAGGWTLAHLSCLFISLLVAWFEFPDRTGD